MKKIKLLTIIAAAFMAQAAYADDSAKHYYTDIPGVEANVLIKTTKAWDGSILPTYGEGQPQISIVRYTFAPGATIPMHMHPVVNAGLLLKGELTIISKSGETVIIKAGQPVVEMFKAWHYGANNGKEPVELIMVYAGIEGTPLVIRENQTQ